jgi:zinc transporter ZupT
MALTDVLRRRGMTAGESAGLAVVTKVAQPLLAIVAFALAPALGGLAPALLGFAAAALVFLALTELVPASYQRLDARRVALLVSTAAGAVVFLHSLVGEGEA